jgi:hypothetical protein
MNQVTRRRIHTKKKRWRNKRKYLPLMLDDARIKYGGTPKLPIMKSQVKNDQNPMLPCWN